MSGGSYNYLCYKDAYDILEQSSADNDLLNMIDALAEHPLGEQAMVSTVGVRVELLAIRERVAALHQKMQTLSQVWKAIEWQASADWGAGEVESTLQAFNKENNNE